MHDSVVQEIAMLSAARSLGSGLMLALLPVLAAAQDNDPPSRAGRISSVLGTVAFQAAGTNDWSVAPLNYTVTSGDRILTSQRGRAEIEVGPYDVRLADSTDLSVVHLTDDFTQLGLNQGTMRVSVYRLPRGDSLEIDTPNGALIIRSAGKYRVDVLPGVSTIVTAEDGAIELSGPGLDQVIRRGQSAELTGANPIRAMLAERPRATEFDRWSSDRDRRQEMSDCSRYVSRDIPGCADLSDHGHWTTHHEYGPVWRPRFVSVGWVPYRYGRWVWSGPWGWTWVEDTPWGFAPFHYGRWVVVGGVWVWAPGPIVRRPYYAPALVVFVGGSHYGRHHQAWFPLGWHEPYYPRYRHSDRYLRYVNITNVRHVTNVDEFVDPRRADRIRYANRQATTVTSTEVFGRRPVVHDVANFRPDEIARAPITRDRWDGPARVATRDEVRPQGSTVFGTRRQAVVPDTREPTRAEPEARRVTDPRREIAAPETAPDAATPRARSPLVFRNSPPEERRRSADVIPDRADPQVTRQRPSTYEPTTPRTIDRRPVITRRSDVSAPPEPTTRPERSRRSIYDAAGASEPSERMPDRRSTPRSAAPPRESAPRQSAPSAGATSPAPRDTRPPIASRRPGGQQ